MKYILIMLIGISLYGKINYSYKDIVSTSEDILVEFVSDENLQTLNVKIKRNSKNFINKKYKNIVANEKKTIIIKQKEGAYNYSVTLNSKDKNNKKINNSFKFKGIKLNDLDIYLVKKDIDLENSYIKLSSNRKIVKADIEVYDLEKKVIFKNSIDYKKPKKKNIKINWEKMNSGNISSIQIKIYDKYQFWSGLELNPFSVDIPHEDIVFESNKFEIDKSQVYKIKNTFKELKKAMDKYGKNLTLNLYIAGYTDTVGSSKDNLILSRNRAKSIAKAFRKLGLKIPIYYQGFGEEVLFVKTKDNVDEEKNRRAVYILSTHKPVSKFIPKEKWHILK